MTIRSLSKKITKLTQTVAWLTKSNERTLRLAQKINDRYSNILNNQTHYLRFRKPLVEKRQKALLVNATNLAKRMANIPDFKSLSTIGKRKGRREVRHMLLVSGNEARKLRAIARIALRPLLNSKSNRNSASRLRLGNGYRAD